MRRILGITLLVISAIGCTNTKNSKESADLSYIADTLVYTSMPDTFPSVLLDTVSWLLLEGSDTNAIKDISNLYVVNGKAIVGDKSQKRIHAYDFTSGKLLYVIDDKGNGPEEYLETAAFTVTPTSIYILDNFSNAISRYSIEDGSFIEKKNVSFVAWDMEAYDDEAFLFTWLSNNPDVPKPVSVPDYAVWQTDSNFNITDTYLPVGNDYAEMYGKQRYFSKHGDEIIFHALKFDGYITFTKDGKPKFHTIEFSNPIPKDKNLRLSDIDGTSWQYLVETPFVTDRFAVVDIAEGGDGMQFFASSGKVYGNSMNWARNIPVGIIGVTDDNRFIGYVNDNPEQYEQLVEFGFQRGTDKVETLLSKGGCCLIIYKMKDDKAGNS